MQISVVIPTCDRKTRLLSLLECLSRSTIVLHEVIIVDSGGDRLSVADISSFHNLEIQYISSERSVCIQRNAGIRLAKSSWVFICDDDIEIPADYLSKLTGHIELCPEAGAVSGLFLQKEKGKWTSKYSITSSFFLLWQYIYKLSIWGEINCKDNVMTKRIKRYYLRKRNHISRAGWPVITDFAGDHFITPLYSLGASLIKKDWLTISPFDEVLDSHGIGEHYGVIAGFPLPEIHVLNNAHVYHHHEEANRLQRSLQYYRRALALDYFRRTKKQLRYVKKRWLLWSLCGNLLMFIFKRNGTMIKATCKLMLSIGFNKNPYYSGHKNSKKVVQPVLN